MLNFHSQTLPIQSILHTCVLSDMHLRVSIHTSALFQKHDLVIPKSPLGSSKAFSNLLDTFCAFRAIRLRLQKHAVAWCEVKTSKGSPSHQAHAIMIIQ